MNPMRWRKMTWVLNIWNAVFLIWLVVGVSDRPSEDCANDPDVLNGVISKSACEDASDVGTGIGVVLILFLWFLGFIVLALAWLMTRPRHRQCPVCGNDVKKNRTACKSCGYDFATGMRPQPTVAEHLASSAPSSVPPAAASGSSTTPTPTTPPSEAPSGSVADRINRATE